MHITYSLNVLHLQPLQYSFYSLHTTSLKYNTVLHLIENASKRLLYSFFIGRAMFLQEWDYGNEYECSCLSVQIVVGQGPGKFTRSM